MPLSLSQPLTLARLRPDILHLHSPYPLGEAANWVLKPAKVTVITHHSDIIRQKGWLRLYGPLLRRVLAATDRIIATSPRYIESSPWLSPVHDRCTAIPLGIDLARFSLATQPRHQPFHILFVGRLRYYKGLDTLLQAMPQIPQACLTVVGTGPMQQSWQALAQELGLAERVSFVGEVDDDDLPGYYRQADLFVLPSNARSEAFGIVLLEAMASGLPCVATELGTGTSWIVQDGVTGFVVPPLNPTAMAQAINTIAADETLRQRFGQAALVRVKAEFSKEVMVRRVIQVYEALLQQ
jgi:rhamnosyl/mannosyltransferase